MGREVRRKVSQELNLMPGRAEADDRGVEALPADPLPWRASVSGRRLARSVLNLERHSASRRTWRSSSRSREEDAVASPPAGWPAEAALSSSEESESTTVL
jgi:hypothetical protein